MCRHYITEEGGHSCRSYQHISISLKRRCFSLMNFTIEWRVSHAFVILQPRFSLLRRTARFVSVLINSARSNPIIVFAIDKHVDWPTLIKPRREQYSDSRARIDFRSVHRRMHSAQSCISMLPMRDPASARESCFL